MKDYITLLQAEIEWCKKNVSKTPKSLGATWRAGFINGIEQAIRLAKEYNRLIN